MSNLVTEMKLMKEIISCCIEVTGIFPEKQIYQSNSALPFWIETRLPYYQEVKLMSLFKIKVILNWGRI